MSTQESLPAQEQPFNPNIYPIGYKNPVETFIVVDTDRIDAEIAAAGTAGAVILKDTIA